MKEALREIGQRGQALYNQQFRANAEKENRGKFLVLDVNSGDFEIDAEDLLASERLLARRPDSVLFGVRIGSPTAYRLGGKKEGRKESPLRTPNLSAPTHFHRRNLRNAQVTDCLADVYAAR